MSTIFRIPKKHLQRSIYHAELKLVNKGIFISIFVKYGIVNLPILQRKVHIFLHFVEAKICEILKMISSPYWVCMRCLFCSMQGKT